MARAKEVGVQRKKGVHLFSDEQQDSAEKAQRRRERDAKRAEKKAQIVARQEDRLKKSCQGDHSEDAQVPVCQGGSKWVSCDKCDSFYLCKKQCRSWPWPPRKTQEKQDTTTTQETQDARLHRAQGQPKTQVNDPKKNFRDLRAGQSLLVVFMCNWSSLVFH